MYFLFVKIKSAHSMVCTKKILLTLFQSMFKINKANQASQKTAYVKGKKKLQEVYDDEERF
ncbi:hypothetical protein [Oceanobacillus profundus]|uniref:hypothetical protein n=1 Tax=Oceanobacillus TaxID=182709 RepID=UPI000BA79358|nr:hypothetical protein [Oceanobacillus profundus]MCM3399771.1 hypothetical protein [Oceanobacillus profundus]PAE28192.1 hypothetical protein CHI07_15530 [Paenibacillus sp. 7884-2]